MNHELVLLCNRIDWEEVESDFAEYYCADNCRMSVPIRTMVGMLLLKSIYNLSDEINTRMAAKYGGRLDKLLGVTSFVDIRI